MKHGCLRVHSGVRLHGVAAAAMALGSVFAGHAHSGEIRIWPTAVARGQHITLGDVAELSGFSGQLAQQLSRTIVAAAPCPGGASTLTVSDIRGALVTEGTNLADIRLLGSARCDISRAIEHAPPAKPRPPIAARAKGPSGRKADESEPQIHQTLETILRDYITARLADLPGRIEVRFGPVNQLDLSLVHGAYQFKIDPKSPARLGLSTFDVKITHPAEDSRVVPILAEVAMLREVIAAKRDINRGQPIESRDLALEERRFTDSGAVGLTDLSLVIGQRATEFIRRGDMVSEKLIEPKPIVHRGQPVTVWVRQGGLVIKTAGRAQQAGGLGDKIEVRREGARRKQDVFEALVTGPGTVTIGESGGMALR